MKDRLCTLHRQNGLHTGQDCGGGVPQRTGLWGMGSTKDRTMGNGLHRGRTMGNGLHTRQDCEEGAPHRTGLWGMGFTHRTGLWGMGSTEAGL